MHGCSMAAHNLVRFYMDHTRKEGMSLSIVVALNHQCRHHIKSIDKINQSEVRYKKKCKSTASMQVTQCPCSPSVTHATSGAILCRIRAYGYRLSGCTKHRRRSRHGADKGARRAGRAGCATSGVDVVRGNV